MKNLITRTLVGIVFLAIMIGGILWRPDTMILLFAVIAGLTMWEYTGLVNDYVEGAQINRLISTVAGIYLVLAVAGIQIGLVYGAMAFVPYIITVVYLLVAGLYTPSVNPLHSWTYTMFGQMYMALPLSLISLLSFRTGMDAAYSVEYNPLLPLSIFIFLWTNDTGAYCCGSLFGRHKLFPSVSPGKTWEGSIGGGFFVVLAAVIVWYFSSEGVLTLTQWIGLAIVVAVTGTWGDLVESKIKRVIGIKDSGNMLPGHGGMLDRFDSSLLAIPSAVVYIYTISLV